MAVASSFEMIFTSGDIFPFQPGRLDHGLKVDPADGEVYNPL
jgi:hypothetical protein